MQIFANFLLYSALLSSTNLADTIILKLIALFLSLSQLYVRNYWSVLLCHIYVDFVKVFNTHTIQRSYLKSFLFAWGMGVMSTSVLIFFFILQTVTDISINFIEAALYSLPLIVHFYFYFKIVYSLCRSFTSAQTANNIGRRLYIATLIFLLSDIIMLPDFSLIKAHIPPESRIILFLIKTLFLNLNANVVSVFYVIIKSNREIWFEFYTRKVNQRSSPRETGVRHEHRNNNIQGGIIREHVSRLEILVS